MATSNNITVVSASGQATGTQDLTVSATPVTGRLENSSGVMVGRSASFTAKGTGSYSSVSSSNTLIVTQQGKSAFISVGSSQSTTAFPASGGDITFTGKSNLKSITMSTGSRITFKSATINGTSVASASAFASNGYAPSGDPGNTAEYNVSFVFTIPENTSTTSTATSSFTLNGSQYTITQSRKSDSSYYLGFVFNNDDITSSNINVTVNANGAQTTSSTVKVKASDGLSWEISEEI